MAHVPLSGSGKDDPLNVYDAFLERHSRVEGGYNYDGFANVPWDALTAAIRKNDPSITTLSLRGLGKRCRLDDLRDAIEGSSHLHTLDLSWNAMPCFEPYEPLTHASSSFPCAAPSWGYNLVDAFGPTLILEDMRMSRDAMSQMIECWRYNDALKHLSLNDNRQIDFKVLSEMLCENTTLQHLELRRCNVRPSDIMYLEAALKKNRTLKELVLEDPLVPPRLEGMQRRPTRDGSVLFVRTCIGDTMGHGASNDADKACPLLATPASDASDAGATTADDDPLNVYDHDLKRWSRTPMGYNFDGFAEVPWDELISAIRNNTNPYLRLSVKNVSDLPFDDLQAAIVASPTPLWSLDLGWNVIENLEKNVPIPFFDNSDAPSLQLFREYGPRLKMEDMDISTEAMTVLLECLENNPNLEELSLSWNRHINFRDLARMLRKNTALKRLELRHCGVRPRDIAQLEAALKHNQTLKELVFEDRSVVSWIEGMGRGMTIEVGTDRFVSFQRTFEV